MRMRLLGGLVLGLWLALPAVSSAQQPGEIFGKVTDTSGAVMPGVTVTLTSPVLLQPQAAVTSESGSYRFPQLAIGLYTVKFELPGFKTVVREGIRIEIGFTAQINAQLEVSAVQESVTVTGESPVVDTRDTSRTARFNQEQLQAIPSARDPWVIIEQSPGVAMDRQNVGGSASGQQSNFVARGAAMSQQKWNLDGVDITDMSATGGSPVYFDFDSFEEMQITMGGADISMQSPGVGVNLVTKAGTDRLRGSARSYFENDSLQSNNVTDAIRRSGASSGNPIQDIKDYGIEVGGPIKRGRAWFWGSYGKQDVKVGINGFYQPTAECQAIKADPLSYALKDINGCLNTDQTLLNNYNAKVSAEIFRNNQASMFFNAAEKVRNARDASDLRPLETTYRQMGVDRPDLGSNWWKTGMPKTYKWSDRQVFSDRLMMEIQYSHVGNNFALTFHEDDLRSVQPAFDIATGAYARSYTESVYVRPTDSIDYTATYFMPGKLGGDHAFKFGFKYRDDIAHTESHWGGNTIARFTNFKTMAASEAQLYRDGYTEYGLMNRNFYIQDSFSRNKLVVNLGVRWDYQSDEAHAADVAANPFYGQPTFKGVYNGVTYTGKTFDQLPAVSFSGAKAAGNQDLALKNWSPVVALTYDLTGNGRNVAKFSYRRYVNQIGTGELSSNYNTVVSTLVRYPWVDVNGDKFVQANEVVYAATPLSWTSGYDYKNPTQQTTTGSNDTGMSAPKTDELLVSFDKQLGSDIAVSGSYIWRKYTDFLWSDTRFADGSDFGSAHYVPVNYTAPASSCPAGARCPEITYYQPTVTIPTPFVYTNRPDYWRGYQGFELSARKRMSKNWMLNGGFSYNDTPVHYDSPASYEDPSNIENLDHGQYAPESSSSGLGNVFVNAKWIFRVSGAYTLPWYDINVATVYNTRNGYPFIANIQTPNRPNGAGRSNVYLEKLGDNRLPNFQQVDFKVSKRFTVQGRVSFDASLDVFNVFNWNTSLSVRPTQNASNANQISSILAPRVARFGVRASW
jgi:carboxypeptidase family protein/TonB-dependent receptor-like protein